LSLLLLLLLLLLLMLLISLEYPNPQLAKHTKTLNKIMDYFVVVKNNQTIETPYRKILTKVSSNFCLSSVCAIT
jgi:hypothetical protein